jgi:hypothetical protein
MLFIEIYFEIVYYLLVLSRVLDGSGILCAAIAKQKIKRRARPDAGNAHYFILFYGWFHNLKIISPKPFKPV